MFEPEILIKANERSLKDFPFPAITVCPNVFARDNLVNFIDIFNKSKKFNDEECELQFSNVLWCQREVLDYIVSICNDSLVKVNVVENILKSSLEPEELFVVGINQPQKTVFSGNGPCFTFNGLSFSELFNTENIHDDFKQFLKFIVSENENETDIEDTSTWSPEKGLKLMEDSDLILLNNHGKMQYTLKVSPEDTKNVCDAETFRIFIHKPNEIVTKMHQNYALNYNEVRKCLGLIIE